MHRKWNEGGIFGTTTNGQAKAIQKNGWLKELKAIRRKADGDNHVIDSVELEIGGENKIDEDITNV